MGIVLQQRDIEILKFVFVSRVASYGQIARKFFHDLHPTILERCLRRHRDAKHLVAHSIRINKKTIHFVEITPKGFDLIKEQWSFEIDNPHYKSESPLHDIHLNEIVLKLESLKSFKGYYSENLLQSSTFLKSERFFSDLAKVNADGGLILNGPDGKLYVYSIEYEQSKKAHNRYLEKFSEYYRTSGIDGVIYVVTEQSIAEALAKADCEICKDRRSLLYLGFYEEVLASNGRIYLENNRANGIGLF